ncbi:MAG: DUF2520 domain-containing protein [Bdellovibrio sp.]|nr:MAG: DUF2520 domain-containing protein [Bdellovibrio sp.]
MRQVPRKFLIIGAGRLARHLSFYLKSQGLCVLNWKRLDSSCGFHLSASEKADLQEKSRQCEVVLLAIKDQAIAPFVQANEFLKENLLIHFSGALSLKECYSMHPLMTFGQKLYSLDFYPKIPFVLEEKSPSFSEVFFPLKNPWFRLEAEKKPLYHALCVASGNFTVLLWQEIMRRFQEELNLPAEILKPYLFKTMENLVSHSESALTGPLQRGDQKTIQLNLEALRGSQLFDVYKSFLNLSQVVH